MQIIKKNLKQGEITVKINNAEDLWSLNQLIETDDMIKGKTERKIKIGNEDERKQSVVRKTVYLEIKAEKVEFHKYSDNLRVNGVIISGPDDVPRGSYHTFNVEPGSIVTIVKQEWPGYQLEKLKEATESIATKILLVMMDREEAIFMLLKSQGGEKLSSLKGNVAKKGLDGSEKKDFYQEIIEQMKEYDERFELQNIIVASPSFWKEYLMKSMPDELKKKITLATCSDVGEAAVKEVLQRPELMRVLEHDRAAKESLLVEEILKAISKDEACYGLADCKEKSGIGAVKELIVSYEFMQKARQEGKHRELEGIMRLVERMSGKVHILSTEEAEKKLLGLGGIAGILRWQATN
ncbi:mRNA surveillance protein pelota [Candidatus Woesearchaeota archaeon]|nr:mRNA surveillance protein pelota [Candidatus Woesearchaeota archaeon]